MPKLPVCELVVSTSECATVSNLTLNALNAENTAVVYPTVLPSREVNQKCQSSEIAQNHDEGIIQSEFHLVIFSFTQSFKISSYY